MWEPWQGVLYNARRLLILGESCYDWIDPEGVEQSPKPDHPIMLVKAQLNEPADANGFMIKLTRSVTGQDWPSPEQREAGWRSVGFTNFVPASVGNGARRRPTPAMWTQAADELRPLLLERLKPRNVIVFGKDSWKALPPADLSLNDDDELDLGSQHSVIERVRGYRLSDGTVARFWSHWHPAHGASWTSIRDAIAKAEATLEIPGWEDIDR